ncbi:MAG TPA: hypothetical protein VFQ45_07110 [Longimicrobium sp.]|nr:hypothetical protein [Longimicrobium sp.]
MGRSTWTAARNGAAPARTPRTWDTANVRVDANDLVGTMFTTAKELRHLAEQQFGEEFVPTELCAENEHGAVLELRTARLGPLVVHAERERHWYPYRIVRVEQARGGTGAAA